MSGALLLAVHDFPPMVGGEASLYAGLARHFGPGEAIVLAPRLPGDAAVDAALPVPVLRHLIPAHGGPLRRVVRGALTGLRLAPLLFSGRVRYLLCGQLLSIGVPSRLIAACARVPYAVFVHGADLADYGDRPPWRALLRSVVAGASAVVVNSRYTADLVERLLPGAARRVVVLPIGVDPAPPADAARLAEFRRRYRLEDGPVLLSVARLVPMKGHDVAIEGLARLAPRFPGLKYLIVGEGPHRHALEDLARARGLDSRVVFAGGVAAGDLPCHYDLATLFVQLSRATGRYDGLEGFGVSFLEAASHGVVSIGGRSGGVPEAILEGESGLLVDPRDPAAFAAAAARLLDDADERRRMAGAARRWAAAHSWSASTRCLRDLVGGELSCAASPAS